jgi:hypothetical protein
LSDRFYTPTLIRSDNDHGERLMLKSICRWLLVAVLLNLGVARAYADFVITVPADVSVTEGVQSSVADTWTVTNTGTSAITVSILGTTVGLSSGDPFDSILAKSPVFTDGCAGTALAPQSSCSFALTYSVTSGVGDTDVDRGVWMADITGIDGGITVVSGESFITVNDVGVPGPIAGAGIPSLIAAASGLMVWWRRRRKIA